MLKNVTASISALDSGRNPMMQSYRVTTFGQPLEKQAETAPEPKGREVLLRVTGCGVCHSDVHLHDGYFDMGGGRKVDLARSVAPPRTLGHEIVGEVVACGPDVGASDAAPVGARRVVYPWIGCGTCGSCRGRNEHLCNQPRALGVNRDGGYATHVLVPDARYLVDFEGLDEAQACVYACSGITAYGALLKAKSLLAGGGELLIIGAGGVGLSGIRMAEIVLGVKPIVADIDQSKWAAAKAAGAKQTIDPSSPDSLKTLMRETSGGVTAAIDFVGAAASFTFGFSAIRKGGALIVVGLFGGAAQLPVPLIPLKAATVMGSYVGSLAEMHDMMQLAKAGKLPAMPVETRPLAEIGDVLARLKAGKIVGRTVVRP
jgi:D-arabinose 1-dehydrogenase-like Zn-dependent alcohol dehydrogenase